MKLMAIRFSKASMISSGEDGSWKPASNDRFQASDALELVNSNLFCSLRTTPEFLDSNDLIERCLVESCAALYEKEQIYKFQASNWSFIKERRVSSLNIDSSNLMVDIFGALLPRICCR